MAETLNRISLLIVTWNGDELLRDCLQSVVDVYGTLPETIVVDNAALKSTEAIVDAFPNTKYVPLPENKGFAGGNNAGLPHCTKEYIILLNNDTRLVKDSISPLVDFLDAHPNAAAAQGTVVLASSGKLDGCGGFLSPLGVLVFRGAFSTEFDRYTKPERVYTIGGAFFAMRRDAIAKVGGLFHDHFKSYYEEIDLCCRICIAGMESWYVPTEKVLHRHSATTAKFKWSSIQRQYYRNIKFSIKTCFGLYGRMRLGSILFLLSLAQSLAGLIRGDPTQFRSHLHAFMQIRRDRKIIKETRKRINALRKLSDIQVLRLAIQRQPWSYYIKLLKTA